MSDLLPNSGNGMVEMGERDQKPNPDDYCKCDECGEQTHADFLIQADEKTEVCQWCYQKRENKFFCKDCDEEFSHIGVPAVCPRCGSYRIWHEFTNATALIREKQKECINQAEAEPPHTAKIFALMNGARINKQSPAA